jgi:RimJ/RimL family protein N-acetyltransferase
MRFARLPPDAMTALVDHDVAQASVLVGVQLTDFFASESSVRLWRIRLRQIESDPPSADWIARAAVTSQHGAVGYAGFHGPPDSAGMVEVGYRVDPVHRRRGHARAMLALLLAHAAARSDVSTLRATISGENVASLATIKGFGFVEVGEQWDEEDGLETIFEVPV